MEITVKMTPEEYDLFRLYQNKKDFFERRLREETEKFRKEHEELCSAVVKGLEVEDSDLYAEDVVVETAPVVTIKDTASAVKALEIAAEWYA